MKTWVFLLYSSLITSKKMYVFFLYSSLFFDADPESEVHFYRSHLILESKVVFFFTYIF